MGKSRKYLADHIVLSRDCDRRQLNLTQPDAAPLRERDIILASTLDIRQRCEVDRRDPTVHVLIFTLDGRARLFTEEFPRKGRSVQPGQIVVLPAHCPHYYRMEGSHWKAIWFYLADSDTWRQLRDAKPHVRTAITYNEIKMAMEGFWAESLRNETRARLAAKHYAEVIVLNLERELDMEESSSNKEMRQRLYKLWDSVSANLGHQWTVAELAEEVSVSPQHLYRVSMRLCGHKPMEMVTLLRMRQAEELLIHTNYMVKAISRLLGYSDAFSFSAAFKKHAGCSPREFRNHNHAEHPVQERKGWSFQRIRSKRVNK